MAGTGMRLGPIGTVRGEVSGAHGIVLLRKRVKRRTEHEDVLTKTSDFFRSKA